MNPARVVVAMSGGVDSSLAAALVAETGVETIGVTMHLAGSGSRCCSLDDADDARRVAERLGIKFYVANYTEEFRKEVIEPFADAYLAGETPIPCVTCNKRFKFDHLLERAKVFGADRVATGHYARLDCDPTTGRMRLWRALDDDKDQTYFLFQLDQEQLERAWFPLGELRKSQVRERARALGLATADKPESQEICFVPDGDYARVVESIRPAATERGGEIVDAGGRVLGRHDGVHRFTVGQRKGLGIASSEPRYVTRLEPASRRVVVGSRSEIETRRARVCQVSWVAGAAPRTARRARVRVRYRHAGALAVVEPVGGGEVRVQFEEPVAAVSPGQAAVFYDAERGEELLGGGWLARNAS
ncbi:MAG: tRNA 2-thiouridine(34) synthase MnmA [Myxococcota bacterium]|nr:tRNA 2-thiouridine(34) synthase MnmA [Myxococcota bacterium]